MGRKILCGGGTIVILSEVERLNRSNSIHFKKHFSYPGSGLLKWGTHEMNGLAITIFSNILFYSPVQGFP